MFTRSRVQHSLCKLCLKPDCVDNRERIPKQPRRAKLKLAAVESRTLNWGRGLPRPKRRPAIAGAVISYLKTTKGLIWAETNEVVLHTGTATAVIRGTVRDSFQPKLYAAHARACPGLRPCRQGGSKLPSSSLRQALQRMAGWWDGPTINYTTVLLYFYPISSPAMMAG